MVTTADIGFHIYVVFFVELILVGLGVKRTVFLKTARALIVTTFGATGGLVAAGCGVEFNFGGAY